MQNPKEETMKCDFRRKAKGSVFRSILLHGVSFMLLFTGYSGASFLQSSMNREHGVGTTALGIGYGMRFFTNLFLPQIMISTFGCKWTIFISMLGYIPYIIAQFSVSFYSLIPTAMLIGVAGGPYWSASLVYLTTMSNVYCSVTEAKNTNTVIAVFFGLFYGLFNLSDLWSNMISSAVFSHMINIRNKSSVWSVKDSFDYGKACGANFCPAKGLQNPNFHRPHQYFIDIIMITFLFCVIFGCLLVAFGMDSLSKYEQYFKPESQNTKVKELVKRNIYLYTDLNQILMIPLSILVGMMVAFVGAEYTESYVTCALGIQHIGYVLMCSSAVSTVMTLASGWIVKCTHRIVTVTTPLLLLVLIVIILLFWEPKAEHKGMFYAVAVLWGFFNAAKGQINSLCAIWFPNEPKAAFSNYVMWESFGFFLIFIVNSRICTNIKLYIILVFAITSLFTYGFMEWRKPPKEEQLIPKQKDEDLYSI